MLYIIYGLILIYGLLVGSFLNVLIYRIPKGENFVTTRSHCMKCGYQLKWYDLIPVFSYLCYRGKCRKCKEPISIQYPLIELSNALFYVVIFYINGLTVDSILYCLFASALVALSMIDFTTYEIPVGFNIFIACLGGIHLLLHREDWLEYAIGAVAVSGFILLIILATRGRGMGGGDCKLMAAAGFLLGWKLIILAFLLGCILGSVIHLLRMRLTHADHVLAFGPYLSMGLILSVLWGNDWITWYINLIL